MSEITTDEKLGNRYRLEHRDEEVVKTMPVNFFTTSLDLNRRVEDKFHMSADVDLLKLAARTPGFTGADLANLVNEAALLAARHDLVAVAMSDFEEAILPGGD